MYNMMVITYSKSKNHLTKKIVNTLLSTPFVLYLNIKQRSFQHVCPYKYYFFFGSNSVDAKHFPLKSSILKLYGYCQYNQGRQNGDRFYNSKTPLKCHKHSNILLMIPSKIMESKSSYVVQCLPFIPHTFKIIYGLPCLLRW